MREFTVDEKSDGKSLVRVVLAQFPNLSASQVHKALRKRDIRQNSLRRKADGPVSTGDVIAVFISDDILANEASKKIRKPANQAAYQIVYEDAMILVINKRPGVTVHQADNASGQGPYLIDMLRNDLQKPDLTLCHRLDRHTGGLLLIAKKPAALKAVQDMMRQGNLIKRYHCLVRGSPEQGDSVIAADGTSFFEVSAWLEKDARRSDVFIHDEKQPGDLPIVTRFRVLRLFKSTGPDQEDVAELEVELVTGRTHQIRAHLAHLGHPLLGDGKYGRNTYNRFFQSERGPLTRQQLFATRLVFLSESKGPLAYLAGRTFEIEADYDWTGADQ